MLLWKEWVTCKGHQETWNIGLKGKTTREVKWYKRKQIEIKLPHLSLQSFGDQNPSDGEV